MLRELDFIDGEWPALFWALGCTTVIFRECLSAWATWLWKQFTTLFGIRSSQEENKVNSTGKKTLGVLSGVGIALAIGVGAYFLRHLIASMLRAVGIPLTMWSHLLSVLFPTEAILVIAAIMLWRKKHAPIAIGILVTCFVMAAHVVVTLTSR